MAKHSSSYQVHGPTFLLVQIPLREEIANNPLNNKVTGLCPSALSRLHVSLSREYVLLGPFQLSACI